MVTGVCGDGRGSAATRGRSVLTGGGNIQEVDEQELCRQIVNMLRA